MDDITERIKLALRDTHQDDWMLDGDLDVVLAINLSDEAGGDDSAIIAMRGAWADEADMRLIADAPKLLRDALAEIEDLRDRLMRETGGDPRTFGGF